MPIGEEATPLCSLEKYSDPYQAARLLLPLRLQEEMRLKIAALKPETVFAELRSYKESEVPVKYEKLMCGVLCLLGRKRNEVSKWPQIKQEMRRETIDEMLEFELTGQAACTALTSRSLSAQITQRSGASYASLMFCEDLIMRH